MEGFKGTPGPWSVDAVNYHDYGIVSDTNGEEVTTLPAERGEHDFNAMLIAAAPELLEACIRLRNQLYAAGYESEEKSLNPTKDLLYQTEQAIAKALGK